MDKKFKAVVFDMDGVILDSEKVFRIHYMKEGLRRGIPEIEIKEVCEIIAGGRKDVNKKKFEDKIGRGIDYFEFREVVMAEMSEHIEKNGLDIKSGVVETLEYLKANNYKIALATSTQEDKATKYLLDLDLYKYFDKLVFGNGVKNGKPAPDIFLKACKDLGVKPEDTIGVEDSINGIKSSASAGLHTVMIIDLILPNDEVRSLANQIFECMDDFLHYLQKEE